MLKEDKTAEYRNGEKQFKFQIAIFKMVQMIPGDHEKGINRILYARTEN